jgi:DNA-binding MarR family transcriptional regulator
MKTDVKASATYVRFLNLVQAIRELPTFPSVDPVEERLLHALAAAWHKNHRVTVLEAMRLAVDVSPTTLHRRLKSLRSKGLLALKVDDTDTRIKYVVPTKKTDQYFAAFGECLEAAGRT